MKKLMTLMLGLSFLMGTVSLFAQDKPADSTAKGEEEGEDQEAEEDRRRQEVTSGLHSLAKVYASRMRPGLRVRHARQLFWG